MHVRCLVVGATGYVGARLVPRLLDEGYEVRVLVRDRAKLSRLDWSDRVQVVRGDVADPAAVARGCRAVDAVVHLVHSMDGPDFAARDRRAAQVLADAAAAEGVSRIVYLSGLQPAGERCSEHLASRREVGEVLLGSAVPAVVLQAGIVVGSGSASFEMIRHLAELSPVLPLPDHAWNRVQPIGVDDVLHYLLAALQVPEGTNRAVDVGGADVLTYRELMVDYAVAAGLARPVTVPLPVALPRLAARAVQALTPVDRHLAGPLIASMAHDLVCDEQDLLPPPPGGPASYGSAVRRALAERGAAGRAPVDLPGTGGPYLISEQVREVDAPVEVLWSVVEQLGGDTGWYTVPGAWWLRGAVDRLLGGVGARRAKPVRLAAGETLDWWHVEHVHPGRSVRLRAEMVLPGTARLEMRAEPTGPATSRFVQRTTFRPAGLPGRAYWYAGRPAHDFLFGVTAQTVAGVAARRHAAA